jgi:hypothetical protein
MFEKIETQAELTNAIAAAELTAAQWKAMARDILGHGARSGKAAREMLHQHYSDNLLLKARIEQVKRSFAA